MWYKTDLMEQILTSESAKQMIDYVSPIYGKSRIGLWLFQVIGLEIDEKIYLIRYLLIVLHGGSLFGKKNTE